MSVEDTRGSDSGTPRQDGGSPDGDSLPCITALSCSPDRTVFTEDNNDDGWISTDTTVDVER